MLMGRNIEDLQGLYAWDQARDCSHTKQITDAAATDAAAAAAAACCACPKYQDSHKASQHPTTHCFCPTSPSPCSCYCCLCCCGCCRLSPCCSCCSCSTSQARAIANIMCPQHRGPQVASQQHNTDCCRPTPQTLCSYCYGCCCCLCLDHYCC